jgi:hypothetical protein
MLEFSAAATTRAGNDRFTARFPAFRATRAAAAYVPH